MDTMAMLDELFKQVRDEVGDQRARQFIGQLLKRAVEEGPDENISESIHKHVSNDYKAFVKKKAA